MSKRSFKIVILVGFICSCASNPDVTEEKLNVNLELEDTVAPDVQEFHALTALEETRWVSENFYPQWVFTENSTIIMEFNGQCIYEYPIQNGIDQNWIPFELDMDCKTNLHFTDTFDIEKHPTIGAQFIKYRTTSDTLFMEFVFQEWTDSINSLFPEHPIFVNKMVRQED